MREIRPLLSNGTRRCLVALLLGMAPFTLGAQETPLPDATPDAVESSALAENPLLQRSPFLPADFPGDAAPNNRRQAPTVQGPLAQRFEFRGYFQLNGEYQFLIREKNRTAGRWVRISDPGAEYFIESFDEKSGQVRLRDGGQSEMLALFKPDPNAAPLPVNGAPPAMATPTNPTINASQVAANHAGNVQPIPPGATPMPPSTTASRRRTPPPPPQWLQERLAERGVDATAITEQIAKGPPNFIPPDPPQGLPPGVPSPPENGPPSIPPNPGNAPGNAPPPLPNMPIPGGPPNFIPPPPPGVNFPGG